MKQDKEYYKKYYQDHKKEYLERSKEWQKNNPERARRIKKRYREKGPGERKKAINRSNYFRKSLKFVSFKKRISPELLAKIKENTRINNKHIKFF